MRQLSMRVLKTLNRVLAVVCLSTFLVQGGTQTCEGQEVYARDLVVLKELWPNISSSSPIVREFCSLDSNGNVISMRFSNITEKTEEMLDKLPKLAGLELNFHVASRDSFEFLSDLTSLKTLAISVGDLNKPQSWYRHECPALPGSLESLTLNIPGLEGESTAKSVGKLVNLSSLSLHSSFYETDLNGNSILKLGQLKKLKSLRSVVSANGKLKQFPTKQERFLFELLCDFQGRGPSEARKVMWAGEEVPLYVHDNTVKYVNAANDASEMRLSLTDLSTEGLAKLKIPLQVTTLGLHGAKLDEAFLEKLSSNKSLKDLEIVSCDVVSLQLLKNFKSLETLVLSGCKTSDTSFAISADFPKLRVFEFIFESQNKKLIVSLPKKWNSLEQLYLSGPDLSISNLAVTKSYGSLKKLTLYECDKSGQPLSVDDVFNLQNQLWPNGLMELRVGHYGTGWFFAQGAGLELRVEEGSLITNKLLDRIASLGNLLRVYFVNSELEQDNLNAIKNIPSKGVCFVSCKSLTNRTVECLSHNSDITWLYVAGKQINDDAMQYLEKMTSLEVLKIHGDVSKAALADLKLKLPNCEINEEKKRQSIVLKNQFRFRRKTRFITGL